MNLHNVRFLKSVTHIDQRPIPTLPEIAVVGRSNVGKSSLINTIFNRKNLAKISSTPGKTRFINYYSIDNKSYFVDLPGYGYAKLAKNMRSDWQIMIESYLKNNRQLRMVFLLIDSRHDMMENDKLMMDWLHHYQIPFILILTKSDKISNNQYLKMSANLSREYQDHKILRFSSKNNTGKEDIIRILHQIVQ